MFEDKVNFKFKIMQKSIKYIFLLTISSLIFSSCSFFSQRYEKVEKGEYKISAAGKKRFSLNNVNGKVKVVKGSDSTAIIIKFQKVVHVKKRELDNPIADEITMTLDTLGTDVKIETEFERRRSEIQFGENRDNRVDYEIYIPENIEVSLDNSNGTIDVQNLTNNAKIVTTNGNIKVSRMSGKLDLETTNGTIKGTLDSTKGLIAVTTNGNINFTFGSKVRGKVNAEVVHGTIKTKNLKFSNLKDSRDKDELEGYLGEDIEGVLGSNSEIKIRLETTNGSIKLTGSDDDNLEI